MCRRWRHRFAREAVRNQVDGFGQTVLENQTAKSLSNHATDFDHPSTASRNGSCNTTQDFTETVLENQTGKALAAYAADFALSEQAGLGGGTSGRSDSPNFWGIEAGQANCRDCRQEGRFRQRKTYLET